MRNKNLEKVERIRAMVREGCSLSETARRTGMPLTTVYRWTKDLAKVRKARKSKPKVKRKCEPEISLTFAQRRNAAQILRSLGGGQVEAPNKPRRFSAELIEEAESLRNYQPRGLEISDETISRAHRSVDWRAMLGATRQAHGYLRVAVQRALENAEARARYIRGKYRGSRQKPRKNDITLGVAA